MRKTTAIILAFLCILSFVGCGKTIYPDISEHPIAFETGEYIDENDDMAGYTTIEYHGRTYIPYGTIGKTLHSEDIDECIGYVIRDNGDTDTRLFTLSADKEHNYLMGHYVATNLMNPPIFYRAVDTKGRAIKTPDYIRSLEYSYWN